MVRMRVVAVLLVCALLTVNGLRTGHLRTHDWVRANDGYALDLGEDNNPSDLAAIEDGRADLAEAMEDNDTDNTDAEAPDDPEAASEAPAANETPSSPTPGVSVSGIQDPAAKAATADAVAQVSQPGTKSVDYKGEDSAASSGPATAAASATATTSNTPSKSDIRAGNYHGYSTVLNRSGNWIPPSSQYINYKIIPTPVINPEDQTSQENVFVPSLGYNPSPSDVLLNAGMGETPESKLRDPTNPVLQADIKNITLPDPKRVKRTSNVVDIMDHTGTSTTDAENLEIGTGVTDDFRILPVAGEGDAGSAPGTDRGVQAKSQLTTGQSPENVAAVQKSPGSTGAVATGSAAAEAVKKSVAAAEEAAKAVTGGATASTDTSQAAPAAQDSAQSASDSTSSASDESTPDSGTAAA